MENISIYIMDKIICDEIIGVKKKKFNEKNITCKRQSFYILLTLSLSTITLLTAVSVYCYLIKYWENKNIYYHFTTQN